MGFGSPEKGEVHEVKLEGWVAIVTVSSTGIGKPIASAFAVEAGPVEERI